MSANVQTIVHEVLSQPSRNPEIIDTQQAIKVSLREWKITWESKGNLISEGIPFSIPSHHQK